MIPCCDKPLNKITPKHFSTIFIVLQIMNNQMLL